LETKLGDINLVNRSQWNPLVVKGKVLVGNSGGEFGMRGWLTAVNADTGKILWRAYATGPDKDVRIGPNFKPIYPADRSADLGVTTWPGDSWKIGGGTGWSWISYDPDLDLIYYVTLILVPGIPNSAPAITNGHPASLRADLKKEKQSGPTSSTLA
jgi:lanthanide-dependent methanol dehydrogenase